MNIRSMSYQSNFFVQERVLVQMYMKGKTLKVELTFAVR